MYWFYATYWYTQINENGIISFNKSYNVRTPLSLPLTGVQDIIAPYWADVDLRGTGQVFYRQTTDPSLLARATSEIRAAFNDSQNVTITNLLVATWSEVGYYSRKTNKVTMVYYLCIKLLICTNNSLLSFLHLMAFYKAEH